MQICVTAYVCVRVYVFNVFRSCLLPAKLLRVSVILSPAQHCPRSVPIMNGDAHASIGSAPSQRQDRLPLSSAVLPLMRLAICSEQAPLADSAYTFKKVAKRASDQADLPKGWRVSDTI